MSGKRYPLNLIHEHLDAGEALSMNLDSPTVKKRALIATGVFLAWCLLEFFLLRGSEVLIRNVDLNEEVRITFFVTKPGTQHFGLVGTFEHAISFEIFDPEQNKIHSYSENFPRNRPRRFTFTPRSSGEHEIAIRRNEEGNFASTVPGTVKLLVNDWRLFTYMFGTYKGEFF